VDAPSLKAFDEERLFVSTKAHHEIVKKIKNAGRAGRYRPAFYLLFSCPAQGIVTHLFPMRDQLKDGCENMGSFSSRQIARGLIRGIKQGLVFAGGLRIIRYSAKADDHTGYEWDRYGDGDALYQLGLMVTAQKDAENITVAKAVEADGYKYPKSLSFCVTDKRKEIACLELQKELPLIMEETPKVESEIPF
jgi:hypothetical protein